MVYGYGVIEMSIYFWDEYLKNVPICKHLTQHSQDIKIEILEYLQQPDALFDYPIYMIEGEKSESIPLYENIWKAVPFSRFEGEFVSDPNSDEYDLISMISEKSKWNCPTISTLISGLEGEGNLVNCFVSKLFPGSVINPHRGWTRDFMRIHMGLVCDPECKITVGEETRTWEEGKLLAFKDGGEYPHSVKHNGVSERIILSMDLRISYLQKFVPELKP